MFNVRLAGGATCMGNSCSPGCRWWCLWWRLFCPVLFPTTCLKWDLGLNWVSFWGISYLLHRWHGIKWLENTHLFEKICSNHCKNFNLQCHSKWWSMAYSVCYVLSNWRHKTVTLQLWRHVYFKLTSLGCHSVKALSTTVGYSLVALVKGLCRHLTYDSWEA